MVIVTGRCHPALAADVADKLGVELTEANLREFADGEIHCRIDESIRGAHVFIMQTHGSPVNDAVMEQLIMIDAAKRASAKSITAVIPNYGYARQDRKTAGREPITAKLLADMLQVAGATRTQLVGDLEAWVHFEAASVEAFLALDLPGSKVVIGDGAEWIWNIADEHFPGAIQIVDLFHARQHLWDLARLLYTGDEARQKRWILRHQPKLDGGKIGKLVLFLRAVDAPSPELAEKIRMEAACCEKNAARMRYPEFRGRHLFVGSGVIEAGCKLSSEAASSNPACSGQCVAPTPSSPCAAAISMDNSKTIGKTAAPPDCEKPLTTSMSRTQSKPQAKTPDTAYFLVLNWWGRAEALAPHGCRKNACSICFFRSLSVNKAGVFQPVQDELHGDRGQQ